MTTFFTAEPNGDTLIVRALFSEVSLEDADDFKKEFYKLIDSPFLKYVLDMSRITFLSSLSIGVLVHFVTKVREKGGAVVFASLSREVETIFSITHLTRIFNITASVDEALKVI